jgi:hypothetical protein
MTRLLATTLLTLTMLAPGLLAHDPRLHQANAFTGEVTSIAAGSFELKTKTGNWKVTFSAATKFEHGKAAVDKTHLKKGEQVGVIGTKLPNGELVAKNVILGIEEGEGHAPAKKGEKTDHKH